MSRPKVLASNLAKPTFDTKFQIDYEWWDKSGQELGIYLAEHLCDNHRMTLGQTTIPLVVVDWVDRQNGQVIPQTSLMYFLLSHCSQRPDYITERTALVDAVFRVLLANGNRPMTPRELATISGRSPDMILRTLSGRTIYKGIRPVTE